MRWVWIGLVLSVAACTATPPPLPVPTTTVLQPVAAGDWLTYHRDNQRGGEQYSLAPPGTLSLAWHTKLDGAVYGEPLVVGSRILAATQNDTVYALAPATGQVQWHTHLGTPMPKKGVPCGDMDTVGITGTMAYDRVTGRVFAVAETAGGSHTLVGLDVATGTVVVRAMADPPKGDTVAYLQSGGLTVNDDRVFFSYGGLPGDCGNYVGTVMSMRTDGTDAHSYTVPTRRKAGFSGPAGGVVDNSRLLYVAGAGASTGGEYDDSDSVLVLAAGKLNRVDIFTPPNWGDDNANGLDLGATSPAMIGSHVLVTGNRGISYVLDETDLSHVVSQLETCPSQGAPAVSANLVVIPCANGPKAMDYDSHGQLTPLWTSPVAAAGSPTVGNGAVWVVDPAGGVLYALDVSKGTVRGQVQIGPTPRFASPTLSTDHAYVGTMDGVVSVAGA
ncbi:PQQ-binding-like beta-propeller repeat protein [Kutzneria kofuensis]|uniref:Outer membrane protein assembly factor BamB n=1 Tax=Kutzneria kofuensis TaxID=103725 RepID=A0A7W9NHW8_9PSEU|nr:PQQ-binding-like beta-propeller repeat protein [Kutzneria kofuensis]MBB5892671.1 outer membrane protein assembly factor BamB [Kutzneria kofuensis]